MQISGPEMRVFFRIAKIAIDRPTGSSDVVGQRVKPDIHHVIIIVGYRDTPFEAGTADREIPQPTGNKALNFIKAGVRPDKIRMRLIKSEQPVLPV